MTLSWKTRCTEVSSIFTNADIEHGALWVHDVSQANGPVVVTGPSAAGTEELLRRAGRRHGVLAGVRLFDRARDLRIRARRFGFCNAACGGRRLRGIAGALARVGLFGRPRNLCIRAGGFRFRSAASDRRRRRVTGIRLRVGDKRAHCHSRNRQHQCLGQHVRSLGVRAKNISRRYVRQREVVLFVPCQVLARARCKLRYISIRLL